MGDNDGTSMIKSSSSPSSSSTSSSSLSSSSVAAMSPFVLGGFEPVHRECEGAPPLRVHGKIPEDMSGVYVKNGPNAQFLPGKGQPYHWFDGDGMVHAVEISGERNLVRYTNRWVRTERFVRDAERGDTVFSFGEMQAGNMMAIMDQRGVSQTTGKILGRMHTNVIFFGGKLLALEETDKPYEMQVATLRTLGQHDFGGSLRHIMCAHPKICPLTGELFIFGHEIDPMQDPHVVSYSVISPSQAKSHLAANSDQGLSSSSTVTHTLDIPLRGPRFMHDMAITRNFAIVFDLPSTFNFEEWQDGRSPWVHEAGTETRFGIFPRHCQDPSQVRWFSARSCQIFHTINAFELDDGSTVVLRACRADSYTMGFDGSDNPDYWLYPYEWRFDMRTGLTTQERRLCNIRCDFPIVSRNVVGMKHRFSYYSTYRSREGDGVPLYDGIVKFDHEQDKVVAVVKMDGHQSCGECSFVPRKAGKRGEIFNSSEDDGYLVMFVSDDRTPDSTELWIYCAKLLDNNSQPLARVVLPQRVPYGFHGNWIDRNEMVNYSIKSRL